MAFASFGTTEPIAWEVAFGTSFLPGRLLLAIRWVFAAVFAGNFLLAFYRFAIQGGYGLWFFIYLSYTGYLVETVYVCILPFATMRAQAALRESEEEGLEARRALRGCEIVPVALSDDELERRRVLRGCDTIPAPLSDEELARRQALQGSDAVPVTLSEEELARRRALRGCDAIPLAPSDDEEVQAGRVARGCETMRTADSDNEAHGLRMAEPSIESQLARSPGQPALIKATVALFMIAHPASLIVAALYWGALQPVQDLCIFTGGVEPCGAPSALSVYLHLTDWILLLVLFFISRIPFYLQNSLYFVAFSVGYAVFAILHYLLGIGVSPATPCPDYPRSECPIYDLLDFHFPGRAFATLGVVLFVAVPAVIIVYWALGRARALQCCPRYLAVARQ